MSFIAEIKSENDLSPERKVAVDEMFDREFGRDFLVYADAHWYAMGIIDGKLVGRVGILQRTISVGQKLLPVGGICGVVTVPEYRDLGIASALLDESVAFIKRRLSLPFALLTCNSRLEVFYKKIGWKMVDGPTVFTQPDGIRTCGGLTMVVELGSRLWPEGRIDLRGLPW
jgi:GNAT superfamily N-acetyltransferase